MSDASSLVAPQYTAAFADDVLTVRMEIQEGWEQWFLFQSDEHWDNPHCDRAMHRRHHEQAKERRAGILKFGDFFCAMQGKWDKRSDKTALRPEHQQGNYFDALVDTAADYLKPYAQNIAIICPGNHECVDPETEVATRRGWVPIAEVSMNDEILSMHPISQDLHYAKPLKTHVYSHTGAMYRIEHRNVDMLVTGNHRVAYLTSKANELRYIRADQMLATGGQVLNVPTCGVIENPDAPLTDDQLMLAGWLMTDGSVGKNYLIYQSKPLMVERIRALLNRMGLSFSERSTERANEYINGVKLKSKPMPQTTFYILAESRDTVDQLGIKSKTQLPKWVCSLSERQFDVFLNEIIRGDGSRHKSAETAMMVYGTREFLDMLQMACTMFGYRALLSSRKRHGEHSYWCLNITKRAKVAVHAKYASIVDYDGYVYCLTTPSGNFFARRNGKVFLTGNSAILKHHETDLTKRLCNQLGVQAGGYSGFVRFLFSRGDGGRSSHSLYWHHGSGGGSAAVTKGIIGANRRSVYLPDPTWVVTGHIHQHWFMTQSGVRLSASGKVYKDEQVHIQLPTYKDEFTLAGGYHVENGRDPRPLGGVWLHLFWDAKARGYVGHEMIRAT